MLQLQIENDELAHGIHTKNKSATLGAEGTAPNNTVKFLVIYFILNNLIIN